MGKLWKMAWRNVWRNGRRTTIALIAIGLGLALMVFFDGFVAGAQQSVYGNAVKLQGGNVQIHAPGYLAKAERMPLYPLEDPDLVVQTARAQPQVVSASRRIRTSGMVSNREGTYPVAVTGIEPDQEMPTSLIAENILSGRFLVPEDEDMILIGRALADRMGVEVGDRITLVGRATHEQMRSRTVTVVGIFGIGLPEIEKGLIYISLLEAQTLFDLREQATEVVVALDKVGTEAPVVSAMGAALPGYEVNSWEDLSPELRSSIEANAVFMDIFALVIILIVGLGILNLMLMAIFERTREIGLLAAMGLKRGEIMILFVLEGMMIGALGALAGALIGAALTGVVGIYGLDYSGTTDATEGMALIGERAYPDLSPDVVLGRAVTVTIIAALASLYPAWQASRREPAEALHYV